MSAQPDPITMDSDIHSSSFGTVVEQKQNQNRSVAAKRDMFYKRTSKIRRRVKTKWADLREKLEVELAASLDDIATTDVKNLRKNIINLMKRAGSGNFVDTESCDSDCQG